MSKEEPWEDNPYYVCKYRDESREHYIERMKWNELQRKNNEIKAKENLKWASKFFLKIVKDHENDIK